MNNTRKMALHVHSRRPCVVCGAHHICWPEKCRHPCHHPAHSTDWPKQNDAFMQTLGDYYDLPRAQRAATPFPPDVRWNGLAAAQRNTLRRAGYIDPADVRGATDEELFYHCYNLGKSGVVRIRAWLGEPA